MVGLRRGVALAACAALGGAGCIESTGRGPEAPELEVMTRFWEDRAALKALLDAFSQRHPDITLTGEVDDTGAPRWDHLSGRIANGNPPDSAQLFDGDFDWATKAMLAQTLHAISHFCLRLMSFRHEQARGMPRGVAEPLEG